MDNKHSKTIKLNDIKILGVDIKVHENFGIGSAERPPRSVTRLLIDWEHISDAITRRGVLSIVFSGDRDRPIDLSLSVDRLDLKIIDDKNDSFSI